MTITLTTRRGIIHVTIPHGSGSMELKTLGRCDHDVELFDQCFDCIWLDNYQRFNEFLVFTEDEMTKLKKEKEEVTR